MWLWPHLRAVVLRPGPSFSIQAAPSPRPLGNRDHQDHPPAPQGLPKLTPSCYPMSGQGIDLTLATSPPPLGTDWSQPEGALDLGVLPSSAPRASQDVGSGCRDTAGVVSSGTVPPPAAACPSLGSRDSPGEHPARLVTFWFKAES